MIYPRFGVAQGAITKFRLVKWGTLDDTYAQASAVTDRIAGVYLGPSDAADGDSIEICMLGECFLEVSGAIGRGMTLTTNASGQGVNAAPSAGTNNKTAAMALQSGTNSVIAVVVVPGWMQG
jgi:hypothetical protein